MAQTDSTLDKASGRVLFLGKFPHWAAATVVVVGLAVLVGWLAHWPLVLQLLPGLAPMKFNTALGFVLGGVGLMGLSKSRGLAVWAGSLVTAIGLLSWLEYVTGWNFGIDEVFVKDFLSPVPVYPGRMSPLAAGCFILIGTGLALAGSGRRQNWRMAAAGLLAGSAATIAFVALFGYVMGIEMTSGWGDYTRMAVHSAATFILLGAGLLVWAWQSAEQEHFNFLHWLPITSSVTLLGMIALTSATSFAQLKNSTDWRRRSYEVLFSAQSMLGELTDMQRGLRGYVLTGQPAALTAYQNGTNGLSRQLTQLVTLTGNNPAQQQRLKTLAADLENVIAYSRRLLLTQATQGLPAVVQLEANGEGLAVVNRTRADLQAFTDEENRRLHDRSRAADTDLHNTAAMLMFGSLLATLLLLLANGLTSREMNRRRLAEAEMQRVATLQKAILDSANYAIISVTPAGVVTLFNYTAERWLGYFASEIVGQRNPTLWHDAGELAARARALSSELGQPIEPGFESFVAKARLGGVDENEWTFIRKDGQRIPVLLSATALTDEPGDITGYLFVVSDIRERKRAEEALHKSEERMRLATDAAGVAVWEWDLKTNAFKWDRQMFTIYGLPPAPQGQVSYQDWRARVLPEDIEAQEEHLQRTVAACGHGQREFRITRAGDNATRHIQTAEMVLPGADGRAARVVGINLDITERKQDEERLRVSEDRFRRAFDDAPIGMALVSPAGRWLKVNRALCEMVGFSSEDLLATDFQHITHPDDLEKDLALMREVLAEKIPSYQLEKRYLDKSGRHIPVMLSVSLVRERDGHPLYFVAQIENIAERKQHEAEREELITGLRHALAEVRTLTGLIPICGWCRKVRSDQGYLQTVEQYIHAHTDARFSHGMCPECAAKFKGDIVRANAKPTV